MPRGNTRVRDTDGNFVKHWTSSESEAGLRRSLREMQQKTRESRIIGCSERQVCMALPAVTPNGVTTVGLWIPSIVSVVMSIDVAYLTKPSSALGAVTLEVKKKQPGGAAVLLQDASAFDLEGLTDLVPSRTMSLALAKATRVVQKANYIYAEITSDNADAVDGVAGVLTITFRVCK